MTNLIISQTYATGFVLVGANNPVSVTSTGLVIDPTSDIAAIYGAPGSAWTITNSGTVIGDNIATQPNAGISLGTFSPTATVTNGIIVNNAGGVISGEHYGIRIDGRATVTNKAGATVNSPGTDAIYLEAAAGTVTNYGVISGFSDGVNLKAGGTIVNEAGATITAGSAGVVMQAAGTLTNLGTIDGEALIAAGGTVTDAGTISNGTLTAIGFSGSTAADRVILDPGAVLAGKVSGGSGTLELASAASAGTLSSFAATGITNFSTLTFDTGARWTVSGNTSSSGLGTLAITGFTIGDTIDLTGFVAVSETFASNALVLTNSLAAQATLHISGAFNSGNFGFASDGSGGTDITEQASLLIPGTYTSTFAIANTAANPWSVASTARLTGTSHFAALYAASGSNGRTIINAGVINGGANLPGIEVGRYLNGTVPTAVITNQADGTIAGHYALSIYALSPTVVNLTGATITSTAANNGRGVLIHEAGTVTNAGVIAAVGAGGAAVQLEGPGTVINTASGTIAGAAIGVDLQAASTVINAGTISAGTTAGYHAVELMNGDLLIADPGAVFAGRVRGGYGSSSTLELASAATAGTLVATSFSNFGTIDFAAGAAWTVKGPTTALNGTIAGFTAGDTIDLTGFVATSGAFARNTPPLTNARNGHVAPQIHRPFGSGHSHLITAVAEPTSWSTPL